MSANNARVDLADGETLKVEAVAVSDFVRRLISKTRATACREFPPFRVLIRCCQETGTTMYLEEGGGLFLRCESETKLLDIEASRVWTINSTSALSLMESMFDWMAGQLWSQVTAGEEIDPEGGVFLNYWVGHRTRPHHMTLAEAERLFGDTPQVNLDGGGPSIDWEGPDRIVGKDPDYQRRKKAAQNLFDIALLDDVERFTGAVNVAFLQSWLKRKEP